MTNYSRQNKKTNKDSKDTGKTGHHIKKGLSAFQKTLTLIGSVLGIITATITIMNAMKSNEQKKYDYGHHLMEIRATLWAVQAST